jgi:two-component system LytT family response regulator
MKVIIIDDEDNNIENLQELLKKYCPEVRIVGIATNAEAGNALIAQLQPDIVFLDIEMPGKNGFELLKSLPVHNFEIIFVTAHHQYGIQAVKFAAIDYILKPIDIEELKAAVAKATRKRAAQQQNLQLENLIQILQQQQVKTEHRIALPTAKETRLPKPKRSSAANRPIPIPPSILFREKRSWYRNRSMNLKSCCRLSVYPLSPEPYCK